MDFEKTYDVLVAGGGVAGVAAALEAARAGLRTALVEKTILLGGLATTGLVNIYLPLCDGRGKQVTFGIAEELLHLSLKYGPGNIPPDWNSGGERKRRLTGVFSPASFVLALDEVLEQAGVDVWLDTLICRPSMEGRRVTGLEVENKSGRGWLKAGCVVDATGDGDVAFRAGAPCAEGDNWLTMWALQASLEKARAAVEKEDPDELLHNVHLGADAWGNHHPEGMEKLRGTDGRSVTRFVQESRRLLREHYQKRQAEVGREAIFPLTLPAMAQFRTTRRILGCEGLKDGQHGQRFASSIGLAADWRKPGFVWEIPYGTLLPQNTSGLLVAGRCISSEGDAWEVTRVIPPAALTGQAAGLAAALSVKAGISPEQLAVEALQKSLRGKGIPVHLEEIYS